MRLLSKELVSLEYREQLQRDLAKASVCRFLVAYISGEGVESIGRHLLTRGLRDGRSFGIGSLSCSCGFEPLLRLQAELPDLRLKYFMDPLVKEDTEPSDISLFHSKLVYLYLEREAKSVVYIGSHNWTRRALGPQGPRNAEASIRFESTFVPDDLDGSGTSVASHVNRHLVEAWNMPPCLPATPGNEPTFREWFEKGCRRSPAAPLKQSTILLAVRRNGAGGDDWLSLGGQGIYLEVERIVMPSTVRCLKLPDYVWSPESFSVAASREAARIEETPGYFVEPDREQQIMDCLANVLFVRREDAKVLPYSNADRLRVGKRISTHPLHETFLGPEWSQRNLRDAYYQRSVPGALVAELDWQNHTGHSDEAVVDLSRLQRVFTTPLERLVETWRETARLLSSRESTLEQDGWEARNPEND